MASVEPGTYRIVNLARNKALRVPNEYPDTISSWSTQDEPNQKWFIQRVSGGYRFKNWADRVLDLHDRGEVYIWPANDVELQKVWKFEQLGLETGEELKEEGENPAPGRIGNTPPSDRSSVQTDEGVAKDPTSPSPVSEVHITQQTREIQALQRQLSEKDQEIERLREGLALLRSQEPSQIAALLERTTQLEELVETLFAQESRRPNNAA
ncbi:unnamed protein product [Rhizoctonia solani]|uniref:Ricin B lectin domain-containing protein n=1 Tax=Rhizoctonia solani TaxID=456999 RepID=A0A8H3GRC9_9AGAM|nr:unnamed protein product [Rhizoctonia solani]